MRQGAAQFILLSFAIALVSSLHASAQTIDRRALTKRLTPEIEKAMQDGAIPSLTIALVAGNKIVWAKGFGHSNLWAKTPATPDTVYLIGSTFKAQSTFALLQLMEQGKFALNDSVTEDLDGLEIRGEDPDRPITYRHLLTHTSGLPGGFSAHPVWGDSVPRSLQKYLKSVLEVDRPPLDKYEYSNPAFTLIAYLIEQFTGKNYKLYIQKNIWTPLEMTDTGFFPTPDMEERLAIPYVIDNDTGKHKATMRVKADVWPAGIVYGTVLDQANWLITNINGGRFKNLSILKEDTVDQVMTRQYDKFAGPIEGQWLNETSGYGLTWWVSKHNGDRLFAHSGSVPGYTAWNLGNLDQQVAVAILTNGHRSHPHLSKLSMKAMQILLESRNE